MNFFEKMCENLAKNAEFFVKMWGNSGNFSLNSQNLRNFKKNSRNFALLSILDILKVNFFKKNAKNSRNLNSQILEKISHKNLQILFLNSSTFLILRKAQNVLA